MWIKILAPIQWCIWQNKGSTSSLPDSPNTFWRVGSHKGKLWGITLGWVGLPENKGVCVYVCVWERERELWLSLGCWRHLTCERFYQLLTPLHNHHCILLYSCPKKGEHSDISCLRILKKELLACKGENTGSVSGRCWEHVESEK